MSQLSSKFNFDPAKIKISKKAQEAILLDFDLQSEHKTIVVEQGTWHILPFAKVLPFTEFFRKEMAGIRLIPGRALSDSPIVTYSMNKVVTVATSMEVALPMLIYRGQLRFGKNPFYKLWQEVKSELMDLHRTMGGTDDLEGLQSVLFDDSLFPDDSMLDLPPDIASRSLERLDLSPQYIDYLECTNTAITKQVAPLPLSDSLGPWKNAATVKAFQINQDKQGQDLQILTAWELAKLPASIDTSISQDKVKHLLSLKGISHFCLAKAAKILFNQQNSVPEEWKSDPIWLPTMAIAEDHRSYNGIAHIESAQFLDESGQPERSFDALISAAFWSYNFQGKALPTTLDAARFLAANHGWEEISEVLERLAVLYNNHIKT